MLSSYLFVDAVGRSCRMNLCFSVWGPLCSSLLGSGQWASQLGHQWQLYSSTAEPSSSRGWLSYVRDRFAEWEHLTSQNKHPRIAMLEIYFKLSRVCNKSRTRAKLFLIHRMQYSVLQTAKGVHIFFCPRHIG